MEIFDKELGIGMKSLLHINNTTSCVYKGQTYAGHDLLDLLNHVRPSVVQASQSSSFGSGFGSSFLSPSQSSAQSEEGKKARALLGAVDDQLKVVLCSACDIAGDAAERHREPGQELLPAASARSGRLSVPLGLRVEQDGRECEDQRQQGRRWRGLRGRS